MTLRLTPDAIAAAYDYLRETAPFKGWRLPPGDEVGFAVTRAPDVYGDIIITEGKPPLIRVSEIKNGHDVTVLSTMAHEMLHLRQYMRGERLNHGKRFRHAADRISAIHGFDPKVF